MTLPPVVATGSTTSRTIPDRFGETINVLDHGAVGDGSTNDLPAFQSALARVATLGGGRLYVPKGAYKFGDGYSEPGSFFCLNVDDVLFDAGDATFIGNVIVGDMTTTSTQPKNVTVRGGIYAPNTAGASPPPSRYATYSNACGIVSGLNVRFEDIRVVAGQYTRAFSIQTDNTYTGGGGVPIRGVSINGLRITGTSATDGLDISSAGADGLIQDVTVENVQMSGSFLRGMSISSGGASWAIKGLTLTDVSIDGTTDYAGQIYYVQDGLIRDVRVRNVGWRGLDIVKPQQVRLGDILLRASPGMVATAPPSGSGFANNTNYGLSVASPTQEYCGLDGVGIVGPFYNGLLPAKDNAAYRNIYIESCTAAAVVSSAFASLFDTVLLKDVAALPAFNQVRETWHNVRQLNTGSGQWDQQNTVEEYSADNTSLVWRTVNRVNNEGRAVRLRPITTGSGVGGLVVEVGGGGAGIFPAIQADYSGGVRVGFYGVTPVTKPTVTGARGGNAALTSLLTKLQSLGLIVDSTT